MLNREQLEDIVAAASDVRLFQENPAFTSFVVAGQAAILEELRGLKPTDHKQRYLLTCRLIDLHDMEQRVEQVVANGAKAASHLSEDDAPTKGRWF